MSETTSTTQGVTDAPSTATPETTAVLSPMDRVKLARDPQRPHTLDYIRELFSNFIELHGDRSFGDDRALLGGLASFRGRVRLLAPCHQ